MTHWSRRLVLLGALGLSGAAWSKDKKDKKDKKKAGRKGGPLGLLSGTVFHRGLSLPGASVTAFATDGGKDKWEGVTDGRGEFALRLPATIDGITYRLRAEAKGLAPQERELTVYEAQRTTANFQLEAAE